MLIGTLHLHQRDGVVMDDPQHDVPNVALRHLFRQIYEDPV